MLHSGIFLAHHIGMALQNQHRNILLSLGSLFDYQDIPDAVSFTLKIAGRRELLQISDDLLFMPRFARHACDFFENFKYPI